MIRGGISLSSPNSTDSRASFILMAAYPKMSNSPVWKNSGGKDVNNFYNARDQNSRQTLTNFDRLWATLGNFGRLWATLGNFGQLWATLGNFGQHRAIGNIGQHMAT